MRAVRLTIALLALAAIFLLAAGGLAPRLYAQVITAPTPVPLTPPAAPGQPQPFATIGALPALAAAPGFAATPAASPTPRVFKCACSGPGFPTAWIGNVSAPSYILARQAASGSCAGYNTQDHVPSPYIAPRQSGIIAPGVKLYNGSAFNSCGQFTGSAITTAPVAAAAAQVACECSQCSCN